MKIPAFLNRFFGLETGSLSVETVLVFPLLAWGFGAMFVFWDGFRLNNSAISGTYTVADLVSRQTAPVTPAFVNGLDDVFTQIVDNNLENELRVTVVRMAVGPDPVLQPTKLELVWSHGTPGLPKHETVESLGDAFPLMALGATMVMVESETPWTPPLRGVLPGRTFRNRVFTSPRFVPQIKFDDGTDPGGGISLDDGTT